VMRGLECVKIVDPWVFSSALLSKDCSTLAWANGGPFLQRYRAHDNTVAGSFFATIKQNWSPLGPGAASPSYAAPSSTTSRARTTHRRSAARSGT
jgi:hypothetical protein